MVPNTVLRGAIGLIDVDSFPRSAGLGSITAILGCTTDSMIEDENTRCSRTTSDVNITAVNWKIMGGYSRVFQKLFNLWVVFRFDLFVVEEILLLALMLHELEAMAVKCIFIFISGYIVDNHALRDVRPFSVISLPMISSQNISIVCCVIRTHPGTRT